ncbi:MAG: hypothetical protein XXXJIFNMEKO3_LKCDNKCA_00017 (plasmid) [Candidatus Erwinia impunctatus]
MKRPWEETEIRAENHPLFPLVVAADCWLQRLLIWTPGQADLIKTVALLLMVGDHLSMLCGLNNDWLRLAGRGAFPLFGLVWALNRLWIWAGVAQGGWILAGLRPDLGNILFAFAVSGQALALMQRHGPRIWPLSLMLVLAWLPFSGGSYGPAGVMMLLLACGVCMTGRRTTRTGLACCLALAMLACGRRGSCHCGAGDTRHSPDGAEPHLQSGHAFLATGVFPAVLRRAPRRYRTDRDVTSAGSG